MKTEPFSNVFRFRPLKYKEKLIMAKPPTKTNTSVAKKKKTNTSKSVKSEPNPQNTFMKA